MPYRILVTGSRTWGDFGQIRDALHRAFSEGCMELGARGELAHPVLVTGACPVGADHIAEDVWMVNVGRSSLERYPANWAVKGYRAGRLRNEFMVDLGADICLAFLDWCRHPKHSHLPPHRSHGSTHCADYAEQNGIPVRRYFP